MTSTSHPASPLAGDPPVFDFPIDLIDGFLDRFGLEVSGRDGNLVTPQLQRQIELLVAGDLDGECRRDLARDLLINPRAIELLIQIATGGEGLRRGAASH